MKIILRTRGGKTSLPHPRKWLLASFAAILCMMALMPMTARAQGNVINTVFVSEELDKTSTVYVGEVVVDGVSEIKYLFSGDITLSNTLLQHLLDGLNGMADGDYASLLEEYKVNAYFYLPEERLALCSNPDLIAAMDENWSSALYVGTLYYADKSAVSEINSNLYDLDAGFKAVLDAKTAQRIEDIENIINEPKCFVTHLGASSNDNVYYTVENGQVIKHVDTYIVYSSEATTVIYTKVELETLMTETPLTFEAVEAGTITVNLDEGATLDAIQYKLNDAEWTDVTWNEAIDLDINDVISFRGDNGTCYINDDDLEIWAGFHFECSNPCYVYGNMMSLIDEDDFATNTTLTEPFTFFHLFQTSDYEPNNSILNHPTKDIVLPATTLAPYCYDGLFADAPNLTRAPELPATTLAEWCYSEMFSGTAITTAPALPATTLAEACYSDMFMNCTSLTTAPDLPAATLVLGCYSTMFGGCTSLNYVKCLATDISADYCTSDWLWGVAETGTFVKAAGMNDWPVGPDAYGYVDGIPEGWTVEEDITTAPLTFEAVESGTIIIENPNGLTIEYNKNNAGWTSTSSDPISIAVAVNDKVAFRGNNSCYWASGDSETPTRFTATNPCYVYGNVMSLVHANDFATNYMLNESEALAYLFAAPTNEQFMFYGNNTTLQNHPSKDIVLPASAVPDDGYMYMFAGCQGLTRAPELLATTIGMGSYHQMFADCAGLVTAPEELPATILALSCYSSMFFGCSSLQEAPALPATTLADGCYMGMFEGCSSLETAPELPATTLSDWCYMSMFSGCTSLTTAPALPATTLAEDCYHRMFEGCTSLTKAPDLPAATLFGQVYGGMFDGCSSLNYVKCLATDLGENVGVYASVAEWLNDVSATGTFVKTQGMNDWPIGTIDGIPFGWTVESVDVFTTDGNWDVAANWSGNVVPADGSDVAIVANATIPSGTTVNADNIDVYGSLTIADGGQLYHNNEGVTATVQKTISAYTPGTRDGWHLIGYSFADNGAAEEMDNLMANTYDLYYYDEPTHYWMNQKDANNNFTELEAAKGYLYANSQTQTIGLKGTLETANATVNLPLDYTEAAENLKGFNLVGNPFAHNVTTYTGTNVATECYRMNGTSTDLMVDNIGETNPLKPGEGFFVKATSNSASITFNSGAKRETTKPASIHLDLIQDGYILDRLIVKKDGEPLGKLTLRKNGTRVFAMNGQQEMAVVIAEGNEQAVNFKAVENGRYTLTVNPENAEMSYLHLIDNLTGANVDLLQTPEYTFEAKTSDYESRFRLVFSANINETESDSFAFINNGNIIVNGTGTLQVFDVLGRQALIKELSTFNSQLSTVNFPAGVYVLRLISGDSVKTQKIVID